jgi:NADP-dependent 3-hydroxy acid dehydrogenase YdfG
MTSLDGKVAAITGASSGIGEATALQLASLGCAVSLGARREDRIKGLAERISADGGRAIAVPTDLADEESAHAFVETTKAELGRVDFLINNAGVMLLGPIYGADTEDWRRMIDVNLFGLLWTTHAALPIMAEQGSGHIVNVSSVAGRIAALGSGVYNATKWGVVGFSESLRQEALNMGVRVTIIEPGYVDTELQGHNKHPMVVEALEKNAKEVPDPLTSGDIADAIVYAVSRPQHVSINEVLIRPTQQKR